MLLQNDTPTLTLNRERASRILYDNEPMVPASSVGSVAVNFPETGQLFKNNHNLTEYNKLIKNEYADKISESVPVNFSQPQQSPQPMQSAMASPQVAAPQFERYYNQANPVPQNLYQSFKPKTLKDFQEVDFQAAAPTDENLTKVCETSVTESIETAEQTETVSATQTFVRLNAKGLIACVSFIAVTALIAILVILNSIAIGNTGARIDQLEAKNTDLMQDYSTAMAEREKAFNDSVIAAGGQAGTAPDVISLPSVKSYNLAPKNSDYSTSLFDQICKFLTSIFG